MFLESSARAMALFEGRKPSRLNRFQWQSKANGRLWEGRLERNSANFSRHIVGMFGLYMGYNEVVGVGVPYRAHSRNPLIYLFGTVVHARYYLSNG